MIIVVAMAFICWKWHQRVVSTYLGPHVLELLESRGYRVCRFCGYVLRGVSTETEYCPECATHIRGQRSDQLLAAGTRLFDQSPDRRQGTPIVRGIELTPVQCQEALMSVNQVLPTLPRWLRWLLYIGALAVLVFMFVVVEPWLHATWPGMKRPVRAVIMAGVPIAIFCSSALAFVFLRISGVPRRARRALREAGYEVCIRCGQYLGQLGTEEVRCPSCRARREPFRPRAIASVQESAANTP